MSNTVVLERPTEPRVAPIKPFPSILGASGWVALFLLFQLVAGIIALVVALANDGSGRPPEVLMTDLKVFAVPMIWSLVIAELLLLLLLWLFLRKPGRVSAIQLDKWSDLSPLRTLGLAVALIAFGLGFNFVYGEYIFPDIEIQEATRKFFAAIPQTLPNQILLFFTVALIAPLLEELLFRGLLQKSLSAKMPIWAAIAISAAVFGAMHMDLYAMPPLIMMGAIFGVIYHLTGSLRVTILLHMVNNAAALTLS
jgi:membrane protease YdiL (CAAX protease family)